MHVEADTKMSLTQDVHVKNHRHKKKLYDTRTKDNGDKDEVEVMNSGDIPASSSRTQTQTLNRWAEYRESLSFDVFGWIAFMALQKRLAMRLPVRYTSFSS